MQAWCGDGCGLRSGSVQKTLLHSISLVQTFPGTLGMQENFLVRWSTHIICLKTLVGVLSESNSVLHFSSMFPKPPCSLLASVG
jgi:hypothetical protein